VLALLIAGTLGGGYYYLKQSMAPKVGHLIVNANVPGAEISLDGKTEPGWVTPIGLPNLSPGPHTIVVSKEGFEGARQAVEVKAGETVSLTLELKTLEAPPSVGSLTIAANVQGARIILDGQSDPSWTTPYVFDELAAGRHALTISKDGYEDYQQSVTVELGGTASVTAELKAVRVAEPPLAPAAPRTGQLLVTSNIPGARIKLDGRSDPRWVTPFAFRDLPAGSHLVEVTQAGYTPFTSTLRVEGGSTATLNADLRVPQGEIHIVTTPPGIEVLIDGKPHGPSPVRALLPLGAHTYRLIRPGSEPYESSFELKHDGHMITRRVDLGVGGSPAGSVVEVRTNPPGAKVFADGRQAGSSTPTSFRLGPGEHHLTISLSGYRPIQRKLIVPSDGSPVHVIEELSPQ
jgi:hypothetical protein